MKNKQKGFIVPLLIAIIVVLAIGGGVYVYENKKTEAPVPVTTDEQNPQNNTQTTNTTQVTTTQNNAASKLPSVVVTSPKGGEVWTPGSTHTITWTTANISNSDKVNISLLTYNPSDTSHPNFSVLTGPVAGGGDLSASGVPANSGKYVWTVPSVTGNYFKIQISDPNVFDKNNVAIQGKSANYFSIVASTGDQSTGLETYTNTQYGFSLQFPDSWKNYKVSENDTHINFYIEGDNVFTIFPFTKAQWAIYGSGEVTPIFISQNGTYVFAYTKTTAYDPNVTASEISAIPSIISTFKFTSSATANTKLFRLYRKLNGYDYLLGQDGLYYKSFDTDQLKNFNDFNGDYLEITAKSYSVLSPTEKYYYGIKDYSVDVTRQINNISAVKKISEETFSQ